MEKVGEIWAIGGGKGGTGKTFIASGVGGYLAQKDKRVVLVDVDIGGANLHTFLGVARPKKSLSDFFDLNVPLENLIVPTGIGNMHLVTGDVNSLSSANVTFTQKLKLFRHIIKLHAHYVLIDLAAGCSYNTLDTFLIADKMIVVLVPEVIAIENMYHFIKNAFFRRVKKCLSAGPYRDTVEVMWKKRSEKGRQNVSEFIPILKRVSSEVKAIVEEEQAKFKVHLIINKVRASEDIYLGASLRNLLLRYLGIQSEYSGFIEYDESIWHALRRDQPFMESFASSRFGGEIKSCAENLIAGKGIRFRRIENG